MCADKMIENGLVQLDIKPNSGFAFMTPAYGAFDRCQPRRRDPNLLADHERSVGDAATMPGKIEQLRGSRSAVALADTEAD
jgi:hypothetical protein